MLIRVITAHVRRDASGEANQRMREFLEELRGRDGLAYVKLARRLMPDNGEELILFEEWETPADLFGWTGGRLQDVRLPAGSAHLFEHVVLTHYESLDRLPEELELEEIIGRRDATPDDPAGSQEAAAN